MPLIQCSECGKLMSDAARACPHCGCPNDNLLCPECGTKMVGGRCPYCGFVMPAAQRAPRRPVAAPRPVAPRPEPIAQPEPVITPAPAAQPVSLDPDPLTISPPVETPEPVIAAAPEPAVNMAPPAPENPVPTEPNVIDDNEPHSDRNPWIIPASLLLALLLAFAGQAAYLAFADSDKPVAAVTERPQPRQVTMDGVTYTYSGEFDANNMPDSGGKSVTVNLADGRVYTGVIVAGHLTDENAMMTMPADVATDSPATEFSGKVENGVLVKGRRTITEGKDKGTYFDGSFKANGEPEQGAWYDKSDKLIARVP